MSTQQRESDKHCDNSKEHDEDERQNLQLLALFVPIVGEFWLLSHAFNLVVTQAAQGPHSGLSCVVAVCLFVAETLHPRLAKSMFSRVPDATQLDACVSRSDYSPCLASADALAYLRTVARKFLLAAGGVTFPDKIAFTGMTLP